MSRSSNRRRQSAGSAGSRAKDPATVAERRQTFFAFDVDADAAETDLVLALTTLGFTIADMRHCTDAESAQAVISEIEAQRNELRSDEQPMPPGSGSLLVAAGRAAGRTTSAAVRCRP
ncbi:MAG: hypothetical protein ABIQ18_32895, partial [Umezawaea sp.]